MKGTGIPMTRRAVVLSGAAALAVSTMPGASHAARSSNAQVCMRVTKLPAGAAPNGWASARRSSRGHLGLMLLASEGGVIAIEQMRGETRHVTGFVRLEI
jgi:hypothetical protein